MSASSASLSTSGRRSARIAVVCGLIAMLAIPVAIAISHFSEAAPLIRACEIGVVVSVVFALIAWRAARAARTGLGRSVTRSAERSVHRGAILAAFGGYVALAGVVAIGFYQAITWYSSS